MTDNARKLGALIRLGIARQSPLDEAGQQVYLEALLRIPGDVVERSCQELSAEPRNDFEPMFPPLGVILQRCRQVRDHWAGLMVPKQLREARPEPLTKDEAKAWIERLKADVQKRRERNAQDAKAAQRKPAPAASWYEREPGEDDE
jgi:hypothetical protein